MKRLRLFLAKLGPGLITGAADDDPSGIATYSLAGAQFGFQFLWSAWLTFPLMAAVQEMCGRIGLVTKSGLARVIKDNYPRPLLFLTTILVLVANIFNIGADLSGMAAAIRLLFPIHELIIGIALAAALVILTIRLPYRVIAAVFKWLTLALFAYMLTFFLVNPNYLEVLRITFLPNLSAMLNPTYILMLVALFGTSISPYLFFWQTSEEAEEEKLKHRVVSKNALVFEKEDTVTGMFFSQIIMYFIIATTGATLFRAGITNINTAAEAAQALRPLAGDLAYLLFAVGIVGTGMLAIPILSGSVAYAVAETLGFSEGLNKHFGKAKGFYLVIALATLLGFLLNLIGLSPIKYLFYSAVLNGLVAPVLILVILLIANNRKIMGTYVNSPLVNLLSIATLLIMTFSAVAIFVVH